MRAERRSGVEEPEHPGAAELLGERGEERVRHPEEHGDDVDAVRADELRPAHRVAEAVDDAAQAGRLRIGRRRDGAHQRRQTSETANVARSNAEGRRQADCRDQHAADGRAENHPEGRAQRAERGGGGDLVDARRAAGGASRGTAAAGRRAPPSPPRGRRAPTPAGSPASEFASRSAEQTMNESSVNSTIRRRSIASASAPPTNAVTRSGASSASPSSPTRSVEPVSW